ncbi:hypothetical protein ACFWA9_14640 [Kitasatospora sp. NPDC059973]|uniref:hypothetical protein n=1 Tax=Kitasatospora sp. NPDC059973 TaxID=3347020 RepID=UPI0036CE8919
MGLHPDQPTARAALPLAPDWWGSWTRTRRPAVRRSEVAAARQLWSAPHRWSPTGPSAAGTTGV